MVLQNEEYYRHMKFSGGKYQITDKRPKLIIEYWYYKVDKNPLKFLSEGFLILQGIENYLKNHYRNSRHKKIFCFICHANTELK